jgi:hypothetical protein
MLYRVEVVVEAHDDVGACHAAIEAANRSDSWTALDWEQPCYVAALRTGDAVDPARPVLGIGDVVVADLPVPGLFTEVGRLAGYAATRADELVDKLRTLIDAIDADGGVRIEPEALVALCTVGRSILEDIGRRGLVPSKPSEADV